MLAALLLSGGGGLPTIDVLLYHGRAHLNQPHFETAARPHSHGDVCTLGSSLPYSPLPTPADVHRLAAADDDRQGRLRTGTTPRAGDRGLLPQPRAPPGLSA